MSPAWSPDGQSLAYVSFENRLPSVYVQILKTGERREVSAHAGVNQAPAWSPDGKKLALTLSTRDGNLDIYVMDLATQALTRITDDPGIDTEPQWSKDGQSLYFTSDRAGGPQIYRVGIEAGDKPRRLTFQGSYNARPRLSPDESQLAFVTQEDGAYRIATMDLRGRGDVQVLTKGHFDVSPELCAERRRASFMRAAIAGAACWRWSAPTAECRSAWSRARENCRSPPGRRSKQRSQTKYTNRLHRRYAYGQAMHLGSDGEINEKNRIDRIVDRRGGAAGRLPQKAQCE